MSEARPRAIPCLLCGQPLASTEAVDAVGAAVVETEGAIRGWTWRCANGHELQYTDHTPRPILRAMKARSA